MSAFSNITYVWLSDQADVDPQLGNSLIAFSNYDEAMNFAKWANYYSYSGQNVVYVWNINGGSGRWKAGAFTSLPNQIWP